MCLEQLKNETHFYLMTLAHGQSYNANPVGIQLSKTMNTHSLAIGTREAKKPRDANVSLQGDE